MDVSRRRYIVHLFIIQLFGCLGWLCNVALALSDLSDSVTGSINFPDTGFALIGNLAVFITSLLRGRLDLEMGVRDVLATRRGPELFPINKDFGLTTCKDQENRFKDASVVMLSYNTSNSSMRQFMKYICNAYKVHSIFLQCFPLKSKSGKLLKGICNCEHRGKDNKKIECDCIVFWNVEDVIMMLARRMPGILIRLSDSLCLLPCPHCKTTGCHGSKQGQYVEETDESGRKGQYVEETDESGRKVLTEKIVDDIFDYISSENAMEQEHSCICIPLSPSGYDYWTKLLSRSFGATGYANRAYSTASLLVPRLTEVSLNLLLTAWFRVDGFSSSLAARRAIKDYVVDEKGSGFAANAFLIKTRAKDHNACQILDFRGTVLGIKTFSYMVGSVNLLCSIFWAMLVASKGRFGKWYDKHSRLPSRGRVVVIMVAIGIALCMDFWHLYLSRSRDPDYIVIIKRTEPTGSKQSTEPIIKVDSKEPTRPTDPTVKVDSKEPTAEVESEEPTAEVESEEPTETAHEVDSEEATEQTVNVDSEEPTKPTAKVWFHPVVTALEMVWFYLKPCFRPVLKVLKTVLFPLKPWFRSVLKVLKTVWFHLKPWFRLVVTVLKMGWFGRMVTALKMDWFRSAVRVTSRAMVWAVIVLEIACILSGSIVLRTLDIKYFGRWLYSALQVLVWIKWITGSYLLGEYPPEYDTQYDYDNGVIVYSSAFLLNSILAGVRGNWSYSLSLES